MGIKYLAERPSAEEKGYDCYKNNVVVCDILARDKGKIKAASTEKDAPPEAHSVVLWKKSSTEIIILDPNDSAFSEVIHGIRYDKVKLTSPYAGKFYTRSSALASKEKDKARDCIDIAVKMGFEISLSDHIEILKLLLEQMSTTSDDLRFLKIHRDTHSSDINIKESFIKRYVGSKEIIGGMPSVIKDKIIPKSFIN